MKVSFTQFLLILPYVAVVLTFFHEVDSVYGFYVIGEQKLFYYSLIACGFLVTQTAFFMQNKYNSHLIVAIATVLSILVPFVYKLELERHIFKSEVSQVLPELIALYTVTVFYICVVVLIPLVFNFIFKIGEISEDKKEIE